ncbi:MAG: methionine gamma-lyase [Defluviitaleaceae bacterium]|nr:methionine gamma-lyase [Defluviitaleaceae bacterium]
MDYTNKGFSTKAVHAGNVKDSLYGSLTTPIYQTSTYVFDSCEQGGNRFALNEPGYIYTRLGNPTTSVLEAKVAALEGAEASVAFSSGMGAISSVFWTICKAGDHIVADKTLYGCTFALLTHGMTRYGVEVTLVDMTDVENLKKALRKETVCVYFETPANPNMKILDIQAIAEASHAYNQDIKVVCDNTFATPALQLPIKLGCDVVVHSATKYLNGHGDVIAGLACGKLDFMVQVRLFGLKDMTGAVLGPFEAFLILRGLKTLDVRMERHCANAAKLVEYLKKHPKVEKLYFPGLEDHPNHAAAKKQMSSYGAMLAFEVKGGRAAGSKLLNNMELCTLAVSLGDAETLVEHPASMTHSTYDSESLAAADIPEGLVRVSVGLENIEDIIADFEQSFAKL